MFQPYVCTYYAENLILWNSYMSTFCKHASRMQNNVTSVTSSKQQQIAKLYFRVKALIMQIMNGNRQESIKKKHST